MTDDALKKAVEMKRQINELNRFVDSCKLCWLDLRLYNRRFKLKTAYGFIKHEIEVNTELAKIILIAIENYTYKLENELEKM